MKIGLVLPALPAYSETFFKNKILGLQKNGHEVVLFVNHSEGVKSYLDCKVVMAPKLSGNKVKVSIIIFQQLIRSIVNFNKSWKLFHLNKQDNLPFLQNIKQIVSNQFLMNEKLDWLHFGFGTMAIGRENVARVIDAKMAVSFRGFDIGIYPIKHPNCYRLLFEKVYKIHVISDDIKYLLYKNGLGNTPTIKKITPAIDTNFFSGKVKNSVENNKIQFTTIARLHWKKGLDYVLEALSLLNRDGFDFQFTIIGDGTEKERLQFAAHQLGLADCVFFAGKLSPEQVKEVLHTTDVYLQYSLQEGFCNAVLEAQAMGLLCVVSNAEGLSENVLDNKTGFVVPKQNAKLLFEKLKEVLALPEIEKQKIREAAIARVQKEFNLEKQQKEFLTFYTN